MCSGLAEGWCSRFESDARGKLMAGEKSRAAPTTTTTTIYTTITRCSDKEEPDAETVTSMLGFQSYWDATYADELANFREHGHAGEVWLLDSNQLSGNIPLTLGSV